MRLARLARSPHLFALITLASVAGSLLPTEASALWPPPETATAEDMAEGKYWPNDPGYGYSKDDDGQWNYYSFIPTPSGSVMPRPEETASGMSIDLAWRLSIGDERVRIAITDSGIKWDEADLIEQVWLNAKELASHKPLHADDSPCGGAGDLAGFDCNGDGVLTVSDYAETASLKPDASGNNPKGDKNNNGRLDGGDLILNFSDGIDDDGNGYVDDIAGWDFMKNDNDPYDDTRYGHGTGEARDSVSQANNGMGEAGGCPKCRFIPMRVGDSFIADVNNFAKAVVYATDNGAKVVQCALGTLNMNRFTQAALDYAYQSGVLVVTSMADENSRHHNMPAAANHTLPVHAIQYDGSSATRSTTYFSYHPCSNFGGQNFLSASGTGCSSEATGELSGISGLLYSASLEYNVTPPLLPAEAQNILFMTADDIDVPESREPGSLYKWSHEGFDQRFGYGRVNANRALEAIRDGKIPPAVDVTSPRWFTVLYKDHAEGPVPIEGTISATRATSFDYVVEWAPGVQPLDADFKVFKQETNVPATTVIGGAAGPIAELDVRTITTTHPRDIDSPYGENDYTITVRVRAVAHYGGMKGDVPGEMRRTYYVHSDPSLAKGFPLFVGDSGEGSPKMADIDGDKVRELIYPTSGGDLHVIKLAANGPVELEGFPFRTNLEDGLADPAPSATTPIYLKAPAYSSKKVDPSLGRESIVNAPAIADLNGDGSPEIVISTFAGSIYVIDSKGKLLPGWPRRLPEVPSCPLDPTAPPPAGPCMSTEVRTARGAFASPVLADMNGDQKLDIIQAAFDGKVYVFDASGADVEGWPVELHYTGEHSEEPQKNRILTTPAVADFNGDGIPEVLVGSSEHLGSGGQAGAVYLLDGRGVKATGGPVLPGWPVSMTSFEIFPLVAEGVPNSGVIGRFDDNVLASVVHGNASLPLILPSDPGPQPTLTGTPANALPVREDPDEPGKVVRGVSPSSVFGPYTKAVTPNTMLPLFSQPSLGDIDQDGTPDVIAAGGSLNLAINLQSQSNTGLQGDHLVAVWSGKTGAMMPGSPFVVEDFLFFNSQAVADLNGDDYPEVITGSAGYYLHAFDGCGREPKGFPKFTGQWIIPTPAVGDLDGDGKLEVAVGTRSGWLYVWHTEGRNDSIIEWESYHHDNRNTGNLETALDQGGKKKASEPLVADMCKPAAVVTGNLHPGGGCECSAAGGGDSRNKGAAGLVVGLVAMLAARRRRSLRLRG
ncbi:MAG TPA: FG-GAP-like repeat-containing protein [Polyangiaceae bacterium]|nr:FG-GAP-like repeat-containing protein [Polyangiaceae bacterium]